MKRRLTLHHPLSPARPHLTLGMTLLVTFVGTSAGTQPTDAPASPTVTVRLSNGR